MKQAVIGGFIILCLCAVAYGGVVATSEPVMVTPESIGEHIAKQMNIMSVMLQIIEEQNAKIELQQKIMEKMLAAGMCS